MEINVLQGPSTPAYSNTADATSIKLFKAQGTGIWTVADPIEQI